MPPFANAFYRKKSPASISLQGITVFIMPSKGQLPRH
jgi:hypothetical protein